MSTLKDLEIEVSSIKKDATGGVIEGTKADGTKVKINMKLAGPETTLVKIRIGIFGDREGFMAIHRQIDAKLESK